MDNNILRGISAFPLGIINKRKKLNSFQRLYGAIIAKENNNYLYRYLFM